MSSRQPGTSSQPSSVRRSTPSKAQHIRAVIALGIEREIDDPVEDEPVERAGEGGRIFLGELGPVALAIEPDRGRADRLAEGLEIPHRLAGVEIGQQIAVLRLGEAGGDEALRRRDRLVGAVERERRGVVDRERLRAVDAVVGPDAALIEEHDVHAVGQALVVVAEIVGRDLDPAAAGPAHHVEQDTLALLRGQMHGEVDVEELLRVVRRVVVRHLDRDAGEALGPRAIMPAELGERVGERSPRRRRAQSSRAAAVQLGSRARLTPYDDHSPRIPPANPRLCLS